MDFEISERMTTVLGMIDEFLHEELYPMEAGAPLMSDRELMADLDEKRKKVKQMGLWAPNHPEEYGGMGLGLVDHGLVSEAVGKSPFGHYVFGCQAPDAGNIEILHQYGTEEQKARYLLPLVAGEIRSCFSMTEVEMPGSNPVMLETTAVKDGEDYVINGQKWYTTAADGAEFAVVMAVTDPEQPPYLRASMIIVPTDTPGFDLVRNINVMGHVGEGYFSHAEILYHSCRVPQSNRLGPEGHGFIIAQERLGPGRIHHCMRWLGVCSRAFHLMCERAMARTIAPGTKLADKDIIRSWISECAANIRAARLLTLHTAWTIEKYGWREARQEISMIKFLVAKAMLEVLDRAIQVHGGLGMTDDTVLAWFWRHERGSRIYDGADEVHKISLAKRILRDIEKHGRWKL
jgi:alkylation response protein AidB-like acyl-CoA dehydrogenase